MNILITGATGFLGKYVCAEFGLSGCALYVVSRRPLFLPDIYSVIVHDFAGEDDFEAELAGPVDAIVHMAHSMGGSYSEQMTFAVRSTRALLNYALGHGIKTFVLVSSLAVLDLAALPAFGRVDAHTPRLRQAGNLTPYAAAKLAQEKLVEEAAFSGAINAVILRPGLIYDATLMSNACAGLIKGGLQLAIDHDGQIPLVSARRTAQQMLQTLTAPVAANLTTRMVLDDHPWTMARYRQALVARGQLRPGGLVLPWSVIDAMAAAAEKGAGVLGLRAHLPELFSPSGRAARLKPLTYWPAV